MRGKDVYFALVTTPADQNGYVDAACTVTLDGKPLAELVARRSFRRSDPARIQTIEMASPSRIINVMMMRDPDNLAHATIIRAPMWTIWAFTLLVLVSNWKETQND